MSSHSVRQPISPFTIPVGDDSDTVQLLRHLLSEIGATQARLHKLEERLEERLDEIGQRIETPGKQDPRDFVLEEHNNNARTFNAKAHNVMSVLMPLNRTDGRPVPGFPPTIGSLAHLFGTPGLEAVCQGFGLNNDLKSLVEFIGADYPTVITALQFYTPPEVRERTRAIRQLIHEHKRAEVGPQTLETMGDALRHNRRARAHNSKARNEYDSIRPLRDNYNLAVDGFPKTLGDLANFGPEWEFMYFLEAYNLSLEKKGYQNRLMQFVGVDQVALDALKRYGAEEIKWRY